MRLCNRSAWAMGALLFATVIFGALLISCGDEPDSPVRSNPLDPGNPETQGDPFQLQATVEAEGIRLDWVRPEGPEIAGFVVLRQKDGSGAFAEVSELSAGTTSWTDLDVEDGHAYSYRILARGAGGEDSSSDAVTPVAARMAPVLRLGGGSHWTASPVVPFTLQAHTATRMKLGETPSLPGDWQSYSATSTWDFAETGVREDGDELRLYAKVEYVDGTESSVVNDAVIQDLLPPVAAIEVLSVQGSTVTVSAQGCRDANGTCPPESLKVRWDWEDDGTWDTSLTLDKTASHSYTSSGPKTIRLAVLDAAGHEGETTAQVTIDNISPEAPSNPNPADGAEIAGASVTLRWDVCIDPDSTAVTYDVYFGTASPPPLVEEDWNSTSYDPGGLAFETTYHWRIVARDGGGGESSGPVWHFTTGASLGGDMIWIPAGNVRLGQSGIAEPVHNVWVDGFWIGKYEVTNGEFAAFIDAGGYSTEAYWNPVGWNWRVSNNITLPANWNSNDYHGGGIPGNEDFPVNGVSWWEADAFCRWAGLRLPTEAEWEKAAKGPSPNTPTYPWGEGISGPRANYWNSGDLYDNNTTPVGYYDGSTHGGYQTIDSPSPYGLYDVAGNLWEWCSTKREDYPYNQDDGRENPPATYSECCRVVRGGSWGHSAYDLRCAARGSSFSPSIRGGSGGFRCASN